MDALYKENGKRVEVYRWNFVRGNKYKWTFGTLSDYPYCPLYPQDYYLTPPDSWEKLEEDLDKCIESDDTCRYHSEDGICAKCTRPDNDGCGCRAVVFSDIKKRIRKLRGDD